MRSANPAGGPIPPPPYEVSPTTCQGPPVPVAVEAAPGAAPAGGRGAGGGGGAPPVVQEVQEVELRAAGVRLEVVRQGDVAGEEEIRKSARRFDVRVPIL